MLLDGEVFMCGILHTVGIFADGISESAGVQPQLIAGGIRPQSSLSEHRAIILQQFMIKLKLHVLIVDFLP